MFELDWKRNYCMNLVAVVFDGSYIMQLDLIIGSAEGVEYHWMELIALNWRRNYHMLGQLLRIVVVVHMQVCQRMMLVVSLK